jgi:hypothetical protein
MWKKLDKKLFKLVKTIILWGVTKSKFKKHKYKLFLQFGYLELFFIFSLALSFNIRGMWWFNIFMILFFISWLRRIKKARALSNSYSRVFNSRKNPIIYKAIKDICKQTFKHRDTYSIKLIVYINGLLLFPIILLDFIVFINTGEFSLFVWVSYFTYSIIQNIFESYVDSVFDFDPPKKKRKKKKAKVTNLQKKRWADMFKQPQTVPNPV